MKPSTLIALASVLDKMAKPLKKNMQPGCHKVDETVVVRITGRIDKSADTMQTPTCSIPLLATLAIFIEKSGIVGDNIARMLQESMTEALLYGTDRENDDGEELPDLTATELIAERCKDIEYAMERVKKLTADLPKQPKSGSTRPTVEFTVVEFAPPVIETVAEAA